jgi:hypothetical protein
MNNQQYLKALKKALGNLEKNSREEIVKEIQSHVQDLGEMESLENKFGAVDELAKKYLEGLPLFDPLHRKIGRFTSKSIKILGVLVLLLLTVLAAIAWYWSKDDFNYADEKSKELVYNKATWQQEQWSESTSVDIDQSKVVFYWHDEDTLRWKCAREQLFNQGKLHLKKNNCLVFLPMSLSNVHADQSRLVLVRPLANANIDITQSQVQIAENETVFRYHINAERSEVAKFQSDKNADVKIAITAFESSIDYYQY